MIGSQKQTCCQNCGIGHCDGPPWEVIVFCPLHAAAPELLTACQKAYTAIINHHAAGEHIAGSKCTLCQGELELLRAAIAKASPPAQ